MKLSLVPAVLCVLLSATCAAFAQVQQLVNINTPQAPMNGPRVVRNYHLAYSNTSNEQNEILSAIRNIASPQLKITVVTSHNEIIASGAADDLKMVEDLLAKLDVPHKLYRLTYTFIQSEGGKRIGVEHFTMVLAPGQRMQMKQGSRVPVMTGKSDAGSSKQTTYIDVGLSCDSEVNAEGGGVRLKSKVEESSITEEKSPVGQDDPVIRQTFLEGTTLLVEGKPLVLGSLDVAGSTRHTEVEALVETVK